MAGRWRFASDEQIDAAAPKTMIYAPVPEPRSNKGEQGKPVPQDNHEPKPGDSPAVLEWRKRMASDEAGKIYKQRVATAECVNTKARNRGLLRMPVRGLAKMKSVVGCSCWRTTCSARPRLPRNSSAGA